MKTRKKNGGLNILLHQLPESTAENSQTRKNNDISEASKYLIRYSLSLQMLQMPSGWGKRVLSHIYSRYLLF